MGPGDTIGDTPESPESYLRVEPGSFPMVFGAPELQSGAMDNDPTRSEGSGPATAGSDEQKETGMQGEAPARPTLVRSESDKMIGGVASGIAHHFGWDVTVVRLVFLAALVLGGSGFMAYILAWVFIPGQDGQPTSLRTNIERLPRWVLPVGAIVLFVLAVSDGDWTHPGPLFAIALLGLGALLLRGESTAPAQRPAARRVTEGATASEAGPVRKERTEPSPLGLYTVAAIFLTVGGAALLDRSGVIDMDASKYLATSLLVVGGGLMVGGFFGRGRALIPLGLLLVPLVVVSGVAHIPTDGYAGDRYFTIDGEMEPSSSYEMFAGTTTIDLTEATATDNPELDISMGFGEFSVIVPEGWRVELTGELQGGELNFFGAEQDGVSMDLSNRAGPASSSESISINVEAGFGEIRIVQEGDEY